MSSFFVSKKINKEKNKGVKNWNLIQCEKEKFILIADKGALIGLVFAMSDQAFAHY
jgi:hypothetical protein